MKLTDTDLKDKIAKNSNKPKYRLTVSRGPARAGLMVTVYGDGTGAFVMRYTRPGGARVFMPLGRYGKAGLSLAQACTAHDEALSLLERGIDPIDEKERRQLATDEARRERAGADTVASLVEQFVHRKLRAERWDQAVGKWVRDPKAKTKARKRPDKAAAMLGYPPLTEREGSRPKRVPTLLSQFGKLKAREVSRRQLVDFLDSIVDRGAPVGANRIYALLKQLFDWAAAKELIPASPMAGVERPGGEESARERVLTAEEIRTFWAKLSDAVMVEPTRIALKLLLVTGQRRGEITFAKWSHFDLSRTRWDKETSVPDPQWTIPVELLKTSRTKKRKTPKPHVVPLPPLAVELLQELKQLTGAGAYLLPAHATPKRDAHYSEAVLSRAVRQNRKHFGIDDFTPHDLRRTAASFMTKLKIPRLHVEQVLNHSTGDIAEVYDRHDYLPEKRAALEEWGKYLQAVVEGREQKVLALETQRARA